MKRNTYCDHTEFFSGDLVTIAKGKRYAVWITETRGNIHSNAWTGTQKASPDAPALVIEALDQVDDGFHVRVLTNDGKLWWIRPLNLTLEARCFQDS